MHTTNTFNPVLQNRIQVFVVDKNWEGLCDYFNSLSHTDFRTACNMMASGVMLKWNPDDFWMCFIVLFKNNAKAWLVTLLKSAIQKYQAGTLSFNHPRLEEVCQFIVDNNRRIDESKLLHMVLPVLKKPEEVETMISYMHLNDERAARFLTNHHTFACYFVLFQHMKRLDNNHELLVLLCAQVLQKGGDKAFNFVSMMKTYFDIPSVKGVFSLQIKPYELSRLDTSFELFCQMLNKI